jgi:hypothetical protein
MNILASNPVAIAAIQADTAAIEAITEMALTKLVIGVLDHPSITPVGINSWNSIFDDSLLSGVVSNNPETVNLITNNPLAMNGAINSIFMTSALTTSAVGMGFLTDSEVGVDAALSSYMFRSFLWDSSYYRMLFDKIMPRNKLFEVATDFVSTDDSEDSDVFYGVTTKKTFVLQAGHTTSHTSYYTSLRYIAESSDYWQQPNKSSTSYQNVREKFGVLEYSRSGPISGSRKALIKYVIMEE